MNCSIGIALVIFALINVVSAPAAALRLRDVTFVAGSEPRECVGTGLVYGLADGGDKDPAQAKALMAHSLKRYRIDLPAEAMSSKEIALVSVKAQIPPYAKRGTRVDVRVSPINDSSPLRGGILAQTPLLGADGEVYAVAQGSVTMVQPAVNDVRSREITSAVIADGGVVENEIPVVLFSNNALRLISRDKVQWSALRIAHVINAKFPNSSQPLSDTTVQVRVPDSHRATPVDFIAQIQSIEIETDFPARIIVMDERTGAIVLNVRTNLSEIAVSKGKIVVTTAEELEAKPKPSSRSQK